MKRYAIYNQANEIIGYGENKTQMAKVIGCTRQHLHNTFDGKHMSYKGEEYIIIDMLAYYYENQMK